MRAENNIYIYKENSETVELCLAGNIEFVDDILTFEELGHFLKSHGCHVAFLSSLEFSTKNGIAGCLKALLREFIVDAIDVGASVHLCIIKLILSTSTVSFTLSFS